MKSGGGLRQARARPTGAAGTAWWARLALVLLLMTMATLGPAAGQAQSSIAPEVIGVRFGVNGDVTRLVLDIDGPSRFATHVLDGPPRLVVELEDVRWRVRDHPQSRPVGLARGVNYGHLASGRARLVLDVARPFRIVRQERLAPSGDIRQHRILVDLVALPPASASPGQTAARPQPPATEQARPAGQRAPEVAAAARPRAAPAGPPRVGPPQPRPGTMAASNPVTTVAPDAAPEPRLPLPGVETPGVAAAPLPTLETAANGDDRDGATTAGTGGVETAAVGPVLRAPPQRRRIIALDPGHGGIDPGTVGINGVLEKEVTFDLAKRLRRLIEATGRYEVVLTREADVFVSLRDRMATARRADAALFISIHADSLGDSAFRGASVYTLSDQASDAEAARLATKENRADVIAGTDLSAHDEIVAGILIDLAQRVTNNKSIEFADVLTAELGDVTALVRNTRRFAGFVVLKSPDVPSVLLELGYLSNPTDAANLAKPEYRDRLARATLRAIDRYFDQIDATL
jgi:N-acetylmuramoyl-L-alanine amidase